ncbi:MAG: DNA repair protein RadA [Spirochaetia bacterium]|nr:DNA repair protein RadA [Spirochaetia bacterium]
MAKKARTVYKCSACSESFIAWMGQCPTCKAWNSFEETTESDKIGKKISGSSIPVALNSIKSEKLIKISTGLSEMDKILGNGMVAGSVILLGGEPGVGKSTLLLEFGKSGRKILYVTGEESLQQIHSRAARIGALRPNVTILQETQLENILSAALDFKPEVLIIDSIQTINVDSSKSMNIGSPAQLRAAAAALIDYARMNDVPVCMTGHITKDGQIAGPKLLEHSVDVVLYFENQRLGQYRFIRSSKNRFGSTGEIAVFEMSPEGLREISGERNLLQMQDVGGVGSILFPQLDGSQTMLVEFQVLVTPAAFSSGRRIGENIDISRIHMIAAILEKYSGFNIGQSDIFVRVQGGAHMNDSAGDLALLLAMASSYLNTELPACWAAAGELSLTGRIRSCSQTQTRKRTLLSHRIPNVIWGGKPPRNSMESPGRQYFFEDVKTCIEKTFQKK